MNIQGWAEIALTLGLSVLLAWPIGIYLSRVWNGESTWLDPVLRPVEGGLLQGLRASTRNAARAGSATPAP